MNGTTGPLKTMRETNVILYSQLWNDLLVPANRETEIFNFQVTWPYQFARLGRVWISGGIADEDNSPTLDIQGKISFQNAYIRPLPVFSNVMPAPPGKPKNLFFPSSSIEFLIPSLWIAPGQPLRVTITSSKDITLAGGAYTESYIAGAWQLTIEDFGTTQGLVEDPAKLSAG